MTKPANANDAAIWTPDRLRDPHNVPDKPQRVREMFSRIAGHYDRANRVNSLGRDQAWRRLAVRAAGVAPTDRVLDVACGTGDLAGAFWRAGTKDVTGLDFVPDMLAVAGRKFAHAPIQWVAGDAMELPFEDASFDIVSIGFGLRNLADTARGLGEFHRVLRPGGRLVVLEFARPGGMILGALGRFFIRRVVPVAGAIITGDRDGAYRYLAASVDQYFTFAQLRALMAQAGFADVRTAETMAMGAVGVHVGVRP